jgi:phosphatidylglycerol lysyltransferase
MGKKGNDKRTMREFFRDHSLLVWENRKIVFQFILMFLFIAIGAWFIRHEQAEIHHIRKVFGESQINYILAGAGLTILYLLMQGIMYQLAFASVGGRVSLGTTLILFLKRNFISIFIPAGGVTSLAFFSGDVENEDLGKTRIHLASSIYGFVGILSVVLVAIPIFIYTLIDGISGSGELFGLGAMILVVGLLFYLYRSLTRRRHLYRLLVRLFPKTEEFLEDLINHTIHTRQLVMTILLSVLIDISCIFMIYLAMLALHFHPSLLFAMLGYLTTIVSQFISPFMRGLGVIEVSLSFVLTRFGYTSVEAVAITLLYRLFEFWVPLVAGALSFLVKINKLLLRIIPAILIFALGIINIISALTPAIHERILRLREFIPLDAIAASNYLVLLAGIFMLLSAVFMLKGLRNAWWIALFLSILSVIGHMTKAIDYEEATAAFLVILMLLYSRKEYYIRGNPRIHVISVWTAIMTFMAIFIYATVGFYFLDQKHFGTDFSLIESIRYAIGNMFLVRSPDLEPVTHFARYFLLTVNISGVLSVSFLFYTIIRPFIFREKTDPAILERAHALVKENGHSPLDYFKTYPDKILFAPDGLNAFLAYRTAGNFAVVLEDPVAPGEEAMRSCISLFDRYCYENSLKSIYYRVPEESLPVYREMGKKTLLLGQEGIVELTAFSLEGGRNKPTRNAINKVIDRGFKSTIHPPPIKDGLMQKLKAVSDEWLTANDRHEMVFSQGMFVWDEIKNQTVITVENDEEKVIAFLNIIPDYVPGEATYDLIRKTDDAPNGVMDFILVELFRFLQSEGYQAVNLGFAPMSGLEDSRSFPEKSMKFAYEKIKTFAHYKGLRAYKDKFFPTWKNKYLVYSDDFDLFQIPAVLNKVIKPPRE